MENISILKLFSPAVSADTVKSTGSGQTQGEFEDVFKSYLNRSGTGGKHENTKTEDNSKHANDTKHAEKTKTVKNGNESKQTASSKTEKTGHLKKADDADKEPETPEEVIDSLKLSEDMKKKLKAMLAAAQTPEAMKAFLDKLTQAMKESGATDQDMEDVFTEMAMTVLTKPSQPTEKDTMLMEQSLDRISEIQNAQDQQASAAAPQLSVVKPNQNQNQQDTKAEVKTEEASANHSQQKGSSESRAQVFIPKEESENLPKELKDKIVELVSKHADKKEKASDQGNSFEAKTDFTEKVIKTEIKIQSPRDILKFAELVELAKSQKATKINIQLHPQELGRVSIELTEHAGKVSGKVFFESNTARHMLASNMEGLKQQLADKGVTVENLEFLFKDFDQQGFSGWQGNEERKGGSGPQDTFTGFPDEESSDEEMSDGIYA